MFSDRIVLKGKSSRDRPRRSSPDPNESRSRGDFVPERVSYLSSSEGKFSLIELQEALKVEEDSLSSFRPQIAANSQRKSGTKNRNTSQTPTGVWVRSYPGMFPPGPMDV